MKYWILTTEYPPYHGGGIGTYAYQLSLLLNKRGVEVSIFIADKGATGYTEEKNDGLRIIRFSPYYAESASLLGYEAMQSFSFCTIVEEYLDTEGSPDWIEAQEYNGVAYYLLQKKHIGYEKFRDLKIAVTCHCPSFLLHEHNHSSRYRLPNYWTGEMERFCIESADACFSPSRYLIDKLKQYGIKRNDIKVVSNPYTSSEAAQKKTYAGRDILFIGKVSPAKGILELLDAMGPLCSKYPDIRLNIAGDADFYFHSQGQLMNVFLKRKYAALFDAGKVILKGTLDAPAIGDLINRSFLVVLPSKMENFPYAVMEAMYRETPVLATVDGGQKEIIVSGVNGFLYDAYDKTALQESIASIIEMQESSLADIGKNAREAVTQYCNPENHFVQKTGYLKELYSTASSEFPFHSVPESKKLKIIEAGKDAGLLSVVIPYFNLGKYIGEAVKSVFESNYKHIELIIVDDGSSDPDSIKELEKLQDNPAIKIIRQPNQGLANARNTGAKAAKGDFLTFLDADDLVHADYYVKAIRTLSQKDNVHFAGCWVKYFGGSGGGWPSFTPVFPYLLFHNMINSSSLVYKRASFCRCGLNDPSFIYGMEDYESVISMMANGCYGIVLPELLFYYRVRKDSMSRSFNESNQKYLYELIARKHEGVLKQYAADIFCLLNANGPGYRIDNPTRLTATYTGNAFLNSKLGRLAEIARRSPRIRKAFLKLKSNIR